MDLHYLDDQDLAWTSLDKFFSFQRPYDMDFVTYVVEWDRRFEEAEQHGGLQIGDTGKCWLFFSRSNLPERTLADLRLKVNGDLTRYREMIRLQLKISKNEQASHDQHQGYRQYYDQDGGISMDYSDHDDNWDYAYDEWYGDDDYFDQDDSDD